MIKIEVCIGSACYVKGSNQLVTMLQSLIKEKNWDDVVIIKGAFCMGMCTQGFGVRVNGETINGLGLHNAKDVIEAKIVEALS